MDFSIQFQKYFQIFTRFISICPSLNRMSWKRHLRNTNVTFCFDCKTFTDSSFFAEIAVSSGDAADTEDLIRGQGLVQYGQDLGVTDDKDPMLIIIAWKLGVGNHRCWEFSRGEFVGGWSIHGYISFPCFTRWMLMDYCSGYNIPTMKKKCVQWREELKSGKFKQFYNFVFDYLKEDRKILGKSLLCFR